MSDWQMGPDAETIIIALPPDGSSSGIRQLREQLALSSDRYTELTGALTSLGLVVARRGRGGGLALTAAGQELRLEITGEAPVLKPDGGMEPKADLVGVEEIADRLGVARSTVSGWHSRGLLPNPLGIVSGRTSVWEWADVEAWAREVGASSLTRRCPDGCRVVRLGPRPTSTEVVKRAESREVLASDLRRIGAGVEIESWGGVVSTALPVISSQRSTKSASSPRLTAASTNPYTQTGACNALPTTTTL